MSRLEGFPEVQAAPPHIEDNRFEFLFRQAVGIGYFDIQKGGIQIVVNSAKVQFATFEAPEADAGMAPAGM